MAMSRSLARFSPFHDPRHDTLSYQIAELSRDLKPIARLLSRRGGEALYEARHSAGELASDVARRGGTALQEASHSAGELAQTAGELAHDMVERLTPVARQAAREIGQRAQYAGQALRSDPLPAVVALGTAALLASLLLRRR